MSMNFIIGIIKALNKMFEKDETNIMPCWLDLILFNYINKFNYLVYLYNSFYIINIIYLFDNIYLIF